MKKNVLLFGIILIILITLTGCQKANFDDDKFNIVTSFYPMYILTQNVSDGIDDVQVTNLTSPTTGCLHDYQITTQDMLKLSHADALVINGDGMENFIEKAINTYKNLKIVNASEGIKNQLESEDQDKSQEENSHYWVSISLYIEQVKNVAEELGRIDEKNKEKYIENARKYIEQ